MKGTKHLYIQYFLCEHLSPQIFFLFAPIVLWWIGRLPLTTPHIIGHDQKHNQEDKFQQLELFDLTLCLL